MMLIVPEETLEVTIRSRFSVNDCIRNNKEPEAPGEEGLKDMLGIEAIYRAAGAPIA